MTNNRRIPLYRHFSKSLKKRELAYIIQIYAREFTRCDCMVIHVREWGSRGLEFESRHSDQEKVLKSKDFGTFSFFAWIVGQAFCPVPASAAFAAAFRPAPAPAVSDSCERPVSCKPPPVPRCLPAATAYFPDSV